MLQRVYYKMISFIDTEGQQNMFVYMKLEAQNQCQVKEYTEETKGKPQFKRQSMRTSLKNIY